MDERIKNRKRWILHVAKAFLLLFLLLASYIAYLQIVKDEELISSQYNRRYTTHQNKGRILDRNGIVLAETDANGYRRYPYGAIFSHVVGYNELDTGSAGIEGTMADALVGKGVLRNFGPLRNLFTDGRGSDIVLTLDTRIQEAAYRALGNHRGAVLVMEASTGEILAMVSKPSYDPTEIRTNWEGIRGAESSPLLNRATQGLYPPGSVIKPLIADAALNDAKTDTDEIFHCEGALWVAGESIRESHYAIHGDFNIANALVASCNVTFGTLALRLGANGLTRAFERYGFERVPEGLDFVATAPVLPNFKTLNEVNTALVGIGQSTLLVTPLSMLMVADTFANHGRMMIPHVVRQVRTNKGVVVNVSRPQVWMTPTAEGRADLIDRYMVDAIKEGTGWRADIENLRVTGKTGTAENGNGEDHAWFIGSAGDGSERIVFSILVEHGGGGGRVAAPIAKQMIETWMKNRGIVVREELGILGKRYELLALVGNGGMADVYKAHDIVLDRLVAVKVLHTQYAHDAAFVRRFQNEAQAAAKMSHPNIVNIYDVGQQDTLHYIVMEYVAGDTLKERLRRENKIPVEEALDIVKEIAEALRHAHANGLVHCDIKPHNILMMADGRIKVADFGIARAVSAATATYSGDVVGSVHYFSPEQAKGAVITPKSDVYSLGVVLYEMLTGKLPFTADTSVAIALQHLQNEPLTVRELEPGLPSFVEALVAEMMQKDPAHRPDSEAALRQIEQDLALLKGRTTGYDDPFATQMMPRIREEEMHVEMDDDSYEEEYRSAHAEKSIFRSKAFLFALIAILFAGFFAGAFLSYGKFWSTAEVVVPDVTGQTLAVAKQNLEDKNLRVNIAEDYDMHVPAGEVISQEPIAGTKVKEERLITITISKGGEKVAMPDLRGISRRDAENRIEKLGLQLGQVKEEYASDAVGTVISQDPRAGSKISKGQVVDIVVSKGEKKQQTAVPNVEGTTEERAKAAINRVGLKVGHVTEEVSSEEKGFVIRQEPAGGTEVETGSTVDLFISLGSQKDTSRSSTKEDKKENSSSAPTKGASSGKMQ